MNKIKDILERSITVEIDGVEARDKKDISVIVDTDQALKEIEKVILEKVIGEDEKFINLYQWQEVEPLNLLKSEQRKAIKELME
ncbi:MAG: hypothetical protein QG623_725 [Patescibacteria group bacterium]|nr:hypothetical protein [Patescibacteria group bacterium]